jgi:hypothetical protein
MAEQLPSLLGGCEAPRIKYVTVWQPMPWQLLMIILSVPVALLGLGAVGFWVAKGFKPSN